MGLKTYIGGPSNVPNSYLELAVPVAGDDVYVPANAGNCVIAADLPSSGQLRSFIVDNGYTGTIDFGNFKVYAGQGNLTGTIFDSGTSANYQCGTGGVQLYSTSSTKSGVNIVKANNANMANVNVYLNSNGLGRYMDFQSDFYCNLLKIIAYSIYLSKRTYMLNIYGGFEDSLINNNANIALNINTNNITFFGGNINSFNTLQVYGAVYIGGIITLLHDFQLSISNTTNSTYSGLYYNTNGSINCNGYNVIYYVTGYNYNHNIYIDKAIDKLIIVNSSNYASTLRILNDITVNNYFSIVETPRSRSPFNAVRSATNGTKINITLGNNCKYLIAWSLLYDLSFNKPVTAFKSSVNNCDNINVVDYPQTIISVK